MAARFAYALLRRRFAPASLRLASRYFRLGFAMIAG
jgi:hypothetical protein